MGSPVEQGAAVGAEDLEAVVARAVAEFAGCDSEQSLRAARGKWLGENSEVARAKKAIKHLEPSERAQVGKQVGVATKAIADAFAARLEGVREAELAAALTAEAVDVTAVPQRSLRSGRHPLELIQEEIADFFTSIGWKIAEGPELEHEWFNFDALNIDLDHPARQMQDTLYVDGSSISPEHPIESHLVMRTHTSPVQGRVLTSSGAPVYMVCPGKVFRSDELDATHTPVFHQVEGLAVDKDLTMAHLRGVLDAFAKHMFGEQARTRFRPSFFPFTEPSAELDLWFPLKKGGPGWIEWGGCGMVNPRVLEACGVDSRAYRGFAFGMGIERTLMLRHGISDMHDIVEGDVRFSQQFGNFGKGR